MPARSPVRISRGLATSRLLGDEACSPRCSTGRAITWHTPPPLPLTQPCITNARCPPPPCVHCACTVDSSGRRCICIAPPLAARGPRLQHAVGAWSWRKGRGSRKCGGRRAASGGADGGSAPGLWGGCRCPPARQLGVICACEARPRGLWSFWGVAVARLLSKACKAFPPALPLQPAIAPPPAQHPSTRALERSQRVSRAAQGAASQTSFQHSQRRLPWLTGE